MERVRWATLSALGLAPDVGTLEVGRKADLVVIDARRPHLVPTLRIVSAFVHNGQAGDVESLMVDGRWLLRDGRALAIDESGRRDPRRGDRPPGVASARRPLSQRPLPHPPTVNEHGLCARARLQPVVVTKETSDISQQVIEALETR
jgi:hypothetical protein